MSEIRTVEELIRELSKYPPDTQVCSSMRGEDILLIWEVQYYEVHKNANGGMNPAIVVVTGDPYTKFEYHKK